MEIKIRTFTGDTAYEKAEEFIKQETGNGFILHDIQYSAVFNTRSWHVKDNIMVAIKREVS